MSARPLRTDTLPDQPYGAEHDACALIISVRKRGESTYGTLKRALGALAHMGHRTGFVEGEGDGAGVQTDIPRRWVYGPPWPPIPPSGWGICSSPDRSIWIWPAR